MVPRATSVLVRTSMTCGGSSESSIVCNCNGSRCLYMGERNAETMIIQASCRGIRHRSAANAIDQGGRGPTLHERDRLEAATPCDDFRRAHRATNVVVAALDDDVGPAREHQRERGVLIEGNDETHRFERSDDCTAVFEFVDRSFITLAEPPSGGIGIEAEDKRRAELPRAVEIGDVPTVENVEYPIGEHQRTRKNGEMTIERFPRRYLRAEARLVIH